MARKSQSRVIEEIDSIFRTELTPHNRDDVRLEVTRNPLWRRGSHKYPYLVTMYKNDRHAVVGVTADLWVFIEHVPSTVRVMLHELEQDKASIRWSW